MKRTSSLAALALCTAFLTGALGAGGSLLSGGCAVSPAITVVHVGPGQKPEEIRGDAVKTRRGGQEAYVGLRGGYYVVRNVEDWRNAWPGGKEPPLPSTLDPSRSMLLLAIAEANDTVQLRINKVVETGDRVHVWVRETKAGENCTAKLERQPFDALVAPRIDKPVKFYVDEERGESCGEPPGVSVNCRVNDTPAWTPKVTAQPGDNIDCEMSSETRGKFALVDSVLSLVDLPGGSSAKLAYTRGPARGTFAVDVFGTYSVRAEAADEAGRKSLATATVDALPPKTRDVLVQLVWTNFDVSDDPDTFPRVKLRAMEQKRDARNKPTTTHECSADLARPELCDVKTRSAYTHMKLKASDKQIPLDVLYLDERIEKGPLVCVQLYFDGVRTGETCDRKHRSADERWQIGVVDMASGKLIDAALGGADAGAGDAGIEAGANKPAPAAKPPAKQ
jgi:hypothetical protein